MAEPATAAQGAATRRLTIASPLGPLTIAERDGRIVALEWGDRGGTDESPVLLRAAQQLDAYFYCELKRFDLPLDPPGSAFQKSVWDAMLKIPRGRTQTYGALAAAIGSVARAVGGACGRNPIPIIIPCHRVLAGGGALGGYSGEGGGATKRFLLELEGAPLPPETPGLL
ncbi:MAG: methylated-DNA--[protein]-cysteine S-methyltransferase [Dongiaceae bacterium]